MNMNNMALAAVKYRFDNFAECGKLNFREAFMRTFCWRHSKPMKLISCALPSVRYAVQKNQAKSQWHVRCTDHAAARCHSHRAAKAQTPSLTAAKSTDCRALTQTARTTFRSPLSPRWKSLSCATDRLRVPKSAFGFLNLTLDLADLFG